MHPQADSPWFFGFPVTTLWGARVRVNPFFLLIWPWFAARLGWQVGTAAFVALAILILLHEYAHVFVARWTGGDAEDVVLWPFGGLALCRQAPTFQSEFLVPAAGPLFHVIAGLALLPFVISSDGFWPALHPIYFPEISFARNFPSAFLMVLFTLNAKLLYLNLCPMLPLDGSGMMLAVARLRLEALPARVATVLVSVLAHLVAVTVAVNISSGIGVQVLLFAYSLLIFTFWEAARIQLAHQFGEYAEHNPYESSEDELSRRPPAPGFFERWRMERERKRQEREEQERVETEVRLDALLEKINQSGINSLSDAERKFLKKASARYRDQGKPT